MWLTNFFVEIKGFSGWPVARIPATVHHQMYRIVGINLDAESKSKCQCVHMYVVGRQEQKDKKWTRRESNPGPFSVITLLVMCQVTHGVLLAEGATAFHNKKVTGRTATQRQFTEGATVRPDKRGNHDIQKRYRQFFLRRKRLHQKGKKIGLTGNRTQDLSHAKGKLYH